MSDRFELRLVKQLRVIYPIQAFARVRLAAQGNYFFHRRPSPPAPVPAREIEPDPMRRFGMSPKRRL
jgi:hypothetical protein